MTPTASPTHSIARRSRRGETVGSPCADHLPTGCGRGRRPERRVLARYTDGKSRPREVITRPGAAGSVLVVDRDAASLGDRRLLAHLGADEPAQNAALTCSRYLDETRGRGCRCRPLTPEDYKTVPFADLGQAELDARAVASDAKPIDVHGRCYRLELLDTGMSIPEMRWRAHPPAEADGNPRPVSVREAIACLERYEPVRTLTLRALARHAADDGVSTTVLHAELERLQDSPIVLNWRLREVVLATMDRQQLSMSEIAIRCERVKRDRGGNESGETSWLARRLGLLAEAGRDRPTPWIHSDVLALIARRGLGISPREVES